MAEKKKIKTMKSKVKKAGKKQAETAKAKSEKPKFGPDNPYYAPLNEVLDPEIGIGLVDMGLIYDVQDKGGIVTVTMTLTSMGCPLGPQMTGDIDTILRMQKGVKDVEIRVVWDPPWTPERMNPDVRSMLFGGF